MDQLNKSNVGSEHFDEQIPQNMIHDRNKQIKESTQVNSTSEVQQTNMKDHVTNVVSVNNEQKDDPNHMPVHRNNKKPHEKTNTHTDTEN